MIISHLLGPVEVLTVICLQTGSCVGIKLGYLLPSFHQLRTITSDVGSLKDLKSLCSTMEAIRTT